MIISNPYVSKPIQKQHKPITYRIFLHGFERGVFTYIDIDTKTQPTIFTESYQRRILCEKSFMKNTNTTVHPNYYAVQFIIESILASTLGKRGCVFTDQIEYANVLIESGFTHYSLLTNKKWRLSFFVSYKPILETPSEMSDQFSRYTAIITPFGWNHPACINFLPFISYLTFPETAWNQLIERPLRRVVPSKFCCSITSENGIYYVSRMVQELSKYKQIDSLEVVRSIITGGDKLAFIQALSQYKFVVCFEGSIEGIYITEKIIQVFLAGVIPIYFGTAIHTNIFNRSAYLYLEKDANIEYATLVRRIVYLDKHDSQYIEMANQPVFLDLDVVDELREQYGIDSVAQHMNNRIATLENS